MPAPLSELTFMQDKGKDEGKSSQGPGGQGVMRYHKEESRSLEEEVWPCVLIRLWTLSCCDSMERRVPDLGSESEKLGSNSTSATIWPRTLGSLYLQHWCDTVRSQKYIIPFLCIVPGTELLKPW